MRSIQSLMAFQPTRKHNPKKLNLIILTSLKYSPGGQLASIDSELINEKNLIHFDLSGELGASIQRTLDGKKVSTTPYLIIGCDPSEEIVASIQRTLDGKSFNN